MNCDYSLDEAFLDCKDPTINNYTGYAPIITIDYALIFTVFFDNGNIVLV